MKKSRLFYIISISLILVLAGCNNHQSANNEINSISDNVITTVPTLIPTSIPTLVPTKMPAIVTPTFIPQNDLTIPELLGLTSEWNPNHGIISVAYEEVGDCDDQNEYVFISPTEGWKAYIGPIGAGQRYIVLYKTTDTGEHWEKIYEPPMGGGDILFLNSKVGWMIHNWPITGAVALSKTADGGITWEDERINAPSEYSNITFGVCLPVFFSQEDGIMFASCVDYSQNDSAMDSVAFITHDGGDSWTLNTKEDIDEIFTWSITLKGRIDGEYSIIYNSEEWYSPNNRDWVKLSDEFIPGITTDYDMQQEYIEKVKSTFSYEGTSFWINGKKFDMQNLNSSINAITDYFSFGNSEFQEPYLFLDCHINHKVGYGAIFDVRKMDFVFRAFGTSFTYKPYNAESIVYALDNCIYNYWGDIIYQNTDTKYYIYDINYLLDLDYNTVSVTLSNVDSEEQTEVTCLNYHTAKGVYPELDMLQSKDAGPLSEFDADLNHDGSNEKLNIYKTEYGDEVAFLELTDSDGNSVRLEYACTSHVGWNSVYLCTMNEEDYLLVFNPYQCTGTADFTYEVYYLEDQNKLHLIDSGFYSFSYGAKEGEKNAFNEEMFRIFADKVNNYLSNSILLMSTEDGTLVYSTKEMHVSIAERYETVKWIAEIKNNLY